MLCRYSSLGNMDRWKRKRNIIIFKKDLTKYNNHDIMNLEVKGTVKCEGSRK